MKSKKYICFMLILILVLSLNNSVVFAETLDTKNAIEGISKTNVDVGSLESIPLKTEDNEVESTSGTSEKQQGSTPILTEENNDLNSDNITSEKSTKSDSTFEMEESGSLAENGTKNINFEAQTNSSYYLNIDNLTWVY